jgi:regulator of protease activity HflC (stomatin/prohibitin superfamily)
MRHSGVGLSFWFDPWTSVVSEVPVDDRELSLVARARTADLQDVTAQVTVSYRFSEPTDVVQRIDFAVDPDTGSWTGNPLEQVAQLLGELASGHVMDAMAALTLREAVSSGGRSLREAIAAGLASDQRLTSSGISVLGARVRSVRGDADMERFLQTPAREVAQTEADRSTFERRALAVDRERAIAENELANRIELAVREQQLVSQEGANARTRAEEAAAAAMIEANAVLQRSRLLTEADARRTREVGEAEAAAEAAKVAVYAEVERSVLAAMVARELAGALPEISNLTITPDLLTGALAALAAGTSGRP